MARRNKEYYNTTTNIFINKELKNKVLKLAEKEHKHLYIYIDEALKKLVEEKNKEFQN